MKDEHYYKNLEQALTEVLTDIGSKLEKISDPCVMKVMANDENSTTFKYVEEGHTLYPCKPCPGTRGSCPNFRSYRELREKYGKRD